MNASTIYISAQSKASIQTLWDCFTKPEHVKNWNFAADSWHCPEAKNNFVEGGTFSYTMAAKDGSFSFDFNGTYDEITPLSSIKYTLEDGRKCHINFLSENGDNVIMHAFEAESMNPEDMQKAGWQAILDNMVRYAESL